MAPSKYKLTYFNSKGLAEPIRYMFAYKNVEYDDVRIEKENWPDLRPKTPFGKLPILEFDGHVLAESLAINRYVAKELGLYGKTSLEGATIDMYLDALGDCFSGVRSIIREEDPTQKSVLKEKLFKDIVPVCFATLETRLKKNGGQHFVGDGITLADIFIACAVELLKIFEATALDAFPLLQEHSDTVHQLPAIKAWIERRPKTER